MFLHLLLTRKWYLILRFDLGPASSWYQTSETVVSLQQTGLQTRHLRWHIHHHHRPPLSGKNRRDKRDRDINLSIDDLKDVSRIRAYEWYIKNDNSWMISHERYVMNDGFWKIFHERYLMNIRISHEWQIMHDIAWMMAHEKYFMIDVSWTISSEW